MSFHWQSSSLRKAGLLGGAEASSSRFPSRCSNYDQVKAIADQQQIDEMKIKCIEPTGLDFLEYDVREDPTLFGILNAWCLQAYSQQDEHRLTRRDDSLKTLHALNLPKLDDSSWPDFEEDRSNIDEILNKIESVNVYPQTSDTPLNDTLPNIDAVGKFHQRSGIDDILDTDPLVEKAFKVLCTGETYFENLSMLPWPRWCSIGPRHIQEVYEALESKVDTEHTLEEDNSLHAEVVEKKIVEETNCEEILHLSSNQLSSQGKSRSQVKVSNGGDPSSGYYQRESCGRNSGDPVEIESVECSEDVEVNPDKDILIAKNSVGPDEIESTEYSEDVEVNPGEYIPIAEDCEISQVDFDATRNDKQDEDVWEIKSVEESSIEDTLSIHFNTACCEKECEENLVVEVDDSDIIPEDNIEKLKGTCSKNIDKSAEEEVTRHLTQDGEAITRYNQYKLMIGKETLAFSDSVNHIESSCNTFERETSVEVELDDEAAKPNEKLDINSSLVEKHNENEPRDTGRFHVTKSNSFLKGICINHENENGELTYDIVEQIDIQTTVSKILQDLIDEVFYRLHSVNSPLEEACIGRDDDQSFDDWFTRTKLSADFVPSSVGSTENISEFMNPVRNTTESEDSFLFESQAEEIVEIGECSSQEYCEIEATRHESSQEPEEEYAYGPDFHYRDSRYSEIYTFEEICNELKFAPKTTFVHELEAYIDDKKLNTEYSSQGSLAVLLKFSELYRAKKMDELRTNDEENGERYHFPAAKESENDEKSNISNAEDPDEVDKIRMIVEDKVTQVEEDVYSLKEKFGLDEMRTEMFASKLSDNCSVTGDLIIGNSNNQFDAENQYNGKFIYSVTHDNLEKSDCKILADDSEINLLVSENLSNENLCLKRPQHAIAENESGNVTENFPHHLTSNDLDSKNYAVPLVKKCNSSKSRGILSSNNFNGEDKSAYAMVDDGLDSDDSDLTLVIDDQDPEKELYPSNINDHGHMENTANGLLAVDDSDNEMNNNPVNTNDSCPGNPSGCLILKEPEISEPVTQANVDKPDDKSVNLLEDGEKDVEKLSSNPCVEESSCPLPNTDLDIEKIVQSLLSQDYGLEKLLSSIITDDLIFKSCENLTLPDYLDIENDDNPLVNINPSIKKPASPPLNGDLGFEKSILSAALEDPIVHQNLDTTDPDNRLIEELSNQSISDDKGTEIPAYSLKPDDCGIEGNSCLLMPNDDCIEKPNDLERTDSIIEERSTLNKSVCNLNPGDEYIKDSIYLFVDDGTNSGKFISSDSNFEKASSMSSVANDSCPSPPVTGDVYSEESSCPMLSENLMIDKCETRVTDLDNIIKENREIENSDVPQSTAVCSQESPHSDNTIDKVDISTSNTEKLTMERSETSGNDAIKSKEALVEIEEEKFATSAEKEVEEQEPESVGKPSGIREKLLSKILTMSLENTAAVGSDGDTSKYFSHTDEQEEFLTPRKDMNKSNTEVIENPEEPGVHSEHLAEESTIRKPVYPGEVSVWDEEIDKCEWIVIQEWLWKMESVLIELEEERDITLIKRSVSDYNNKIRFPDVILSADCGIFIHEDPSADPTLPLQQFIQNYSIFKRLWFVFIEFCSDQYNLALGLEAIASDLGSACQVWSVECTRRSLAGLIYDVYRDEGVEASLPLPEVASCHERLLIRLFPVLNPVNVNRVLKAFGLVGFLAMPTTEELSAKIPELTADKLNFIRKVVDLEHEEPDDEADLSQDQDSNAVLNAESSEF